MEENFTLTVSHAELYRSDKCKKTDWIEWCWQNIGENNFDWTIDVQNPANHSYVDYVYHIQFKNEGDKVLFILNWL